MAVNLKTIFRLLGAYARMDLAWFLRDTKYCLLFMLPTASAPWPR